MRFVRSLLAFLLGLAGMAALLLRVLPGDQGAYAEPVARAHECQILFVGPSYLQVGLNVDLFQEETRRLGRELRACKFTRSALRSWELRHDLENLLAYRWPKLERVAIDISLRPDDVGFDKANWFNPRLVFWHTWASLPWLTAHYRRAPFGYSWPAVTRELWPHAEHVAVNYLGVGRAASAFGEARVLDRLRGETAGEEPREVNRLRKKAKVKVKEGEYPRFLAGLVRRKARLRDPGDDSWARELEAVVRKRGFEPVFLYSPVLDAMAPPRLHRARKSELVFLDFDDPARYPELYVDGVRGSTSHLNRTGSIAYSRALAREFVALEAPR